MPDLTQDDYETALREWARLSRNGARADRLNAVVDKMQRRMLVLRQTRPGRGTIERLSTDPDPEVRAWAAVAMTLWNSGRARRVLVELRDAIPETAASLSAKYALIELDKGTLNAAWDPDALRPRKGVGPT